MEVRGLVRRGFGMKNVCFNVILALGRRRMNGRLMVAIIVPAQIGSHHNLLPSKSSLLSPSIILAIHTLLGSRAV